MNLQSTSTTVRWPMALLLAGISMLLLPALTHSILVHPPEYDELLHILAARSINETGISSIADGLYPRAELYTRLIAWVTGFSDNELVVARLPALVFGMLTTAMLTAWVSLRVGWIAAIATAGVFVIAPMTLNFSVIVRFYTLHTLIMAALLLYWFEASSWKKSPGNLAVMAVVSVILIWLGLQFHDLTKVTVLSGAAALTMVLLFDNKDQLFKLVRGWPISSGLIVVSLIALVALIAIRVDVMALLRGTLPLWSANRANNYAFYISALSVELPFIWPLFPLLLIFAFYEMPRLVVFCLTAFFVSLVVNSIAGQKATRYFYHAYPMFCILWAVGFQRAFMYTFTELQNRRGLGAGVSMFTGVLVMSLCLVSAHEIKRGIKLVLDKGKPDDTIAVMHEPDWTKALPLIGELAQIVDTLVVTSGVKGLHTFGRYDYEMSTTVVQETDTGLEFGTDPRTNRLVIGLPESVHTVIEAEGQALFVLENRMINKPYSSPIESISVLNQRCEAIDLSDTGSQLSAWLC